MKIININKYISLIENNNLILYFYKKDLFSIILKDKNIVYINSKKYLNNITLDVSTYKIIEYKFLDQIYNKIQLNNTPL